jgi:4-hydroxyphenylacetate 3-monooxygenase
LTAPPTGSAGPSARTHRPRSGADYLAALDDGRVVIVDGKRVDSIAQHPAFAGITSTIAALYDFAADPANGMTYDSPEINAPALTPFMIPRSADDLRAWRLAVRRWAELSHGFVGRSPDHVGAFLASFASAAGIFDTPDRKLGANVTAWHRKLLRESPYVSYVIVPPQVSRTVSEHDWEGDFVQVGIKEERPDGLVLRGAQMLGTATAVSDHVLISCIKPLTEDDADHAVTAIVPTNAPGLHLYCRRPYASGQPSAFDYPMSARFDETDAVVIFNDVLVPWENVFACRDVRLLQRQFFGTAAHVLGNLQAITRLSTKLQFLIGIARKVCEVNQIDRMQGVIEMLGELAALGATIDGLCVAAEADAAPDEFGLWRPNATFVYAAISRQADLYPRVIHLIRELVGGGVMQLPSSYREMVDPATREDLSRFLSTPTTSPDDRVKLFKLAWDVIGSEFAGRHEQYEMFYAGAPFVTRQFMYRNYPFDSAVAQVDGFLASYGLPAGRTES